MKLARVVALWAMLWLLLFILYRPALQGEFLFDDFPNIVNNPAVHLTELSADSLHSTLSGPEAGPLGRPVSVISLALTHYLFGLNPYAFKATNLVLHGLNGVIAWWLVTLILVRACGQTLTPTIRTWLPLWISAAWLLHPINVVPILLSVQRMTQLSALFVMLALIAHIKFLSAKRPSRKVTWLTVGWLVCWPLAILSKETGILFPLLASLITLLHPPGEARQRSGRHILAWALVPLTLVVGPILFYLGWNWLQTGYSMRTFSLVERIMTESRVLWIYASQILIPSFESFGLFIDDIPVSTSLMQPITTVYSIVGWAILITVLPFAWRRWPVPVFGVMWYLVGHSLESTFLPLEIAHEYRNYLPSLGLLLSFGWLGAALLTNIKLDHRRATVFMAALFPIAILSSYTAMRAQQWSNTVIGMQIETIHHPDSPRANYAAAQTLFRHGHGDANDPIGEKMIRYHFERAGALDKADKYSFLGLVAWACASGRPVEATWKQELTGRLKTTTYSPNDRELPDNLLKSLINVPTCLDRTFALGLFEAGAENVRVASSLRSRFQEAAADYELLVSKDPHSAYEHLSKAYALNTGDLALKAKLDSFRTTLDALKRPPSSANVH